MCLAAAALLAGTFTAAVPAAPVTAAPPAPITASATANVSWPEFLRRHDMVWAWEGGDNRTWPASWQTAAWCGNGVHGLSPLVDHATAGLRFEVARTDVWSCGYAPRLPIGFLRLRTAGAMLRGAMRQSLSNGTVSGTLTTTEGTLRFRAWTSATHPASVVELRPSAGERGAALELVAEPAFARTNQFLDADRMRNPPPQCSSAGGGGVSLCTQRLACDPSGHSGYTTALLRASARAGAADAQTYFVSVGNHQPTANMYPNLAAVTDQNSGQSPPLHRTDSQGNATAEALANVRAAAAQGDGLLEQHLDWWRGFYTSQSQNSFISIPDTRLEGFYHIQQAKIGQAMRPDGVGITDQVGPFRADLAVICAREPAGVNGTGWPFQM